MQRPRRSFLKSALGAGAGVWAQLYSRPSSGIRFEGIAIEPSRAGSQEATLAQLEDGRLWLLFGQDRHLVGQTSSDGGRSWTGPEALREKDGARIPTGRNTAHHTLFRLPSGALGLVYGGPYVRSGRDGTVLFRRSDDGGKSWSTPTVLEPRFAVCRNGSVRVLKSGRILAPLFAWVSSYAGRESEQGGKGLCYSWTVYSDDEGRTWQRSLSEPVLILEEMQRGAHHFEEPVVEELRDGRILMYGRTALGRFYQSFSSDQGVSWSVPEPTSVAASYAPCTLVRIPSTGDLLLVWNQASPREVELGLSRHRLSCAVSRDEARSWKLHRNLESLDDTVYVPPPDEAKVTRSSGYRQPSGRKRYFRAPGPLRCAYATVAFLGDEVVFAYDYGYGTGRLDRAHATKIKIVTRDWLYQPVAKVVTAFDRPCIPADCVAIRSHTPGMLPHRALSGGRRNGLGARGTFTTDCYGGPEG